MPKNTLFLANLMHAMVLLTAPCNATPSRLPANVKALEPDAINLPASVFLSGLTSQDNHIRERAHIFMLGVQEATEGRGWCGYQKFKTITFREDVYEYFKKLPGTRHGERAALIIEEALRKNYPCKASK